MGLCESKLLRKVMRAFVASVLLLFASSALADKPDILEIMTIRGVIDDYRDVQKQVEEINDNPRVKGVLLVVDSPGGGVLASSAIYEELSKLKVPVVGWCDNICASGGMYVLMSPSVKYIGVRSTTISGSIGVVMSVTKFSRLLDWAKIDATTFKSGRFKAAGDPTAAMGEEERAHLQETIDVLAARFYALVRKARPKITDAQFADIQTAKIYFGPDGVKAGLVDEVMTLDQATKKAKDLSGSKLIYTRDEIKKMSKFGDKEGYSYESPAPKVSALDGLMTQVSSAISYVVEVAKEVRSVETVKVSYHMGWSL
jgi:signal peptide peptidase SppA